jgi:four helix bundle protein
LTKDVDVVVDLDGDGDVNVAVDVFEHRAPTVRHRTPCHVRTPCHMDSMLSFQRLDVYQRAIEFLALTAKVSADTPRGNAALTDQLRRAACSIPLNIAEAAGRTGKADAARAYAIARGSAMECAAALDAMVTLKVIDAESHRRGCELLGRVVSMLTRLCR